MRSLLRSAARGIGLGKIVRAFRKTNNFSELLRAARPRAAPTRYLSIAAVFRDEAPHLAEWLEFHRCVGVEHVYLYDDGSTDEPCKVLEPYIHEGFVTVIPWAFRRKSHNPTQGLAFVHAILNFGLHWRWMAFIDIDEFLFPVEGNSLPARLVDYESLPAVAVYWTMYGFNGHESRPSGLTIENYTKRAPDSVRVYAKSIVDPSKVIGIKKVHMFDFAEGRMIAYDEQKRLVRHQPGTMFDFAAQPSVPSNILRLNHYYTRSRREFAAKIARFGPVATNKKERMYKYSRLLEEGAFPDDTILRFVPELKRRLHARAGGDHRIQQTNV